MREKEWCSLGTGPLMLRARTTSSSDPFTPNVLLIVFRKKSATHNRQETSGTADSVLVGRI